MPLFAAFVKLDEMENIGSVAPKPGVVWKIDVRMADGDDAREGAKIYPSNKEEIPNANLKGIANFLIKFKDARDTASCLIATEFSSADKKIKKAEVHLILSHVLSRAMMPVRGCLLFVSKHADLK